MRAAIVCVPIAALLAGCSMKIDTGKTADDGTVDNSTDAGGNVSMQSVDGKLALSVPGFSARLAIPGLHFSPTDMDFDGLKLFPDGKTTGMNVDARDKPDGSDGDGVVRVSFASSAPPQAVLAYYREAAPRAGYAIDPSPAAGSAFSASKPKDDGITHVAVALRPDGSGSAGTVTVTGG